MSIVKCKGCDFESSEWDLLEGYCMLCSANIIRKQVKDKKRIKELDFLRASVRISLIAIRAAIIKGGEVSEEQLTELIDELNSNEITSKIVKS